MKALSLCLVLFVTLTPLDDVVALASLETDDDALAAQNNDFVTDGGGPATRLQRDPAPLPGRDQPPPAAPVVLPLPWARQAGTLLAALSGPQLRLVFLSLLC
jgi:hypothetical protein